MQRAVILLRVNDRNVKARQRFRALATRLAARLADTPVLAAYVVPGTVPHELTLTRAVDQVLERGATQVAVVPCEVEWKVGEWQDVPDTIQEIARERTQARFRLAQPLGGADDLVDVVANRCDAAWSMPDVAAAGVAAMVDIGAQPPIAVAKLRPGEAPQLPAHAKHVFVCFGRVCQQDDSAGLYDQLMRLLSERGLDPAPGMHGLLGRQRSNGQQAEAETEPESAAIKVSRSKCLGPCAGSPLLCVYPQGDFYWGMDADLLPRFVDEVLVGNGTLPGHTIRPGEAPAPATAPAAP